MPDLDSEPQTRKTSADVTVFQADYANPEHARALSQLLDLYARDPMGGGEPLSEHVLQKLAVELAKIPGAVSFLAKAEHQWIGLLTAFQGFSTFHCKPLLNIHDVVVAPGWREQGVAKKLLAAVEEEANRRGCIKLTLEVLSGNVAAQRVYRATGFAGYELDPNQGQAMFWEKSLRKS